MKRKSFLLTVTLLAGFLFSYGQTNTNGDLILNIGLGLGNNYTAGGMDFSNSIPPLSASLEYIVRDDLLEEKAALGIGGFAQYMNYNYGVSGIDDGGGTIGVINLKSAMAVLASDDWKYNKFIIGPRGYFHYSFIEKLDTYTGLAMGLDFTSWGRSGSNETHTAFFWAWFLGGRYYFTDNLGAMLELGYGATYANIGIAFKFNQ